MQFTTTRWRKKYWYTLPTLKTVVRLAHVLMSDVTMLDFFYENTLPRNMVKREKDECTRKNTQKLSDSDVDFIADEVYCRNQIEVIEDTTDYHFDMTDDEISLESLDQIKN